MPKQNLSKFLTPTEQNSLDEELIQACKAGNLNQVRVAMENGADLLYQEQECLRQAVIRGSIPISRYLIKAGANINLYNGLLSEAVRNDNTQAMIDFLLSEDIYLGKNQSNLTGAIIEALQRGKKEAFLHLIDLSIVDKKNIPVFHLVKFSVHAKNNNIMENLDFFQYNTLMKLLIERNFSLVNDSYTYAFFHEQYEKYPGDWIEMYFDKISSAYAHDKSEIMADLRLPRFRSYFLHEKLTQDMAQGSFEKNNTIKKQKV